MDQDLQRLFELHAEVCKTLANPRRLEILHWLRQGEQSVDELSELSDLAQSRLSQHLNLLKQKGLVDSRREGLYVFYRVKNPKILQACDILKEVLWEYLAETQEVMDLLAGAETGGDDE